MSKIQWCDKTINPVIGCKKISPACDNCYAITMSRRLQSMKLRGYDGVVAKNKEEVMDWTGRLNFVPSELLKPKQWKKPKRIFLGSMTDIFHKDIEDQWLSEILNMIIDNPTHVFMILTKRADVMEKRMKEWYTSSKNKVIKNLWLGVTVENQEQAISRVPYLLHTIASKRFVSVEPLLEEINLSMLITENGGDRLRTVIDPIITGTHTVWDGAKLIIETDFNKLDWVIVGGESGSKARPMDPNWVLSIKEKCEQGEVPFFFKQWGEYIDESQITHKEQYKGNTFSFLTNGALVLYRCGRKLAQDLINGKQYHAFPKEKDL